jgi:hypothetical protein
MTKDDRTLCAVCAWRGTCAKKFSKSGTDLVHCVDYSRDVTIKPVEEEEEEEDEKDKEKTKKE